VRRVRTLHIVPSSEGSYILPENQISPKYRLIEMITALRKPVDTLDICNFFRRCILHLCWSDHRILSRRKTCVALQIH
jgi:hypothetical protein